MNKSGQWHGDQYYFGLHYDLHAGEKDTELGTRCGEQELAPMLELMAPDFVQTDCKGHPGYTSWFSKVAKARRCQAWLSDCPDQAALDPRISVCGEKILMQLHYRQRLICYTCYIENWQIRPRKQIYATTKYATTKELNKMLRKLWTLAVAGIILAFASTYANGDDAKTPDGKFLPAWPDGPFIGNFAVYQNQYFDFILDTSGQGFLHLKNNAGEVVGQPVRLGGLNLYYHKKDERGRVITHRRLPLEALETYRPLRNPREFTVKGKAQDNVEFTCKYSFSRNSFTYEFDYSDVRDTEPKTSANSAIRFAPSHTIALNVEQKEREQILAGCVLTLRQLVERRRVNNTFPYWSSVTSLGNNIEEMQVVGPWAERKLSVRFQGILATSHIYHGNCPWQGYIIVPYFNQGNARRLRVSVTVD